MRRSIDLLVFESGDAIGEEAAENGALGCEAARRINSRMGVFTGVLRSNWLREDRNFPGAGISLTLGFGGSSSWAETLGFDFSWMRSALGIVENAIKPTRSGVGDPGPAGQDRDLWSSFDRVDAPSA